ncbi:Protein kinase-like domain containing protein [Rhypophila sp. PSN 637]
MDLECHFRSPNAIVCDFRDYIDNDLGNHLHKGFDGNNRIQPFVCKQALESFWSVNNIREVIGHDLSTEFGQLSVVQVATSYVQIFSILCYIGSPSSIASFVKRQLTDEHLPFRGRDLASKIWTTASEDDQTRRLFLRWQWIFSPLKFGEQITAEKKLSKSQILPIRPPMQLHDDKETGNMGTALYHVELYNCCKPEQARSNEVVFKVFDSGTKDLWENEAKIYARVSSAASPDLLQGVTRFYGSYVLPGSRDNKPFETGDLQQYTAKYGNTFGGRSNKDSTSLSQLSQAKKVGTGIRTRWRIIVLEYAQGGSLSRFCAKNSRRLSSPNWKGRLAIWHQMFNILLGLGASHRLNIVHRDLNRTNILYQGTGLHHIEVPCFRIADFGMSKASIEQDEPAESSYLFNYVHMAPECIGCPDYHGKLPPPERYTPAADIWALGCLFSEMLIRCSPLGECGVAEYRRRRIAENEHTRLKGLEWAGGFHNGGSRLSCVEEMHRLASEAVPERDRGFLEIVSRIILDYMLQPKVMRERLGAAEIRSLWLDELRRWEDDKTRKMRISADRVMTSDITKSSSLQQTTPSGTSRPSPASPTGLGTQPHAWSLPPVQSTYISSSYQLGFQQLTGMRIRFP